MALSQGREKCSLIRGEENLHLALLMWVCQHYVTNYCLRVICLYCLEHLLIGVVDSCENIASKCYVFVHRIKISKKHKLNVRVWLSGIVVSTLALINIVNQRQARLVLRWAILSGFISRCQTFILVVTNQPPKAISTVHPSGVGKWVPASAGNAKAGMVHSISGWMRGVQVKLWDPLRMRAIPERLRGVFTTRRYTNSRLPLPFCWHTK